MNKLRLSIIVGMITIFLVGCESNVNDENNESLNNYKTDNVLDSESISITMINPKTINPILNTDESINNVMDLVYDGLFTIDENYNVVEELAQSYEVYNDGLSIDIELKDAKWHNEKDITSEDVKFTVDLIKKNPNSPYFELVNNINGVSVKGSKQLTINLQDKYAFSKETLIFPILSKDMLENTQDVSQVKYNLIGSGPYKIANYEPRKKIELEVNDNYYNKNDKYIKKINVMMVPDEESLVSMVNALKSDIAKISKGDLSKFDDKKFKVNSFEGREYEVLIFNYDNKMIQDINFRKAIESSIDKDLIISEGYSNEAHKVNFPINTSSEYYNKETETVDYSIEASKEYLSKVKLPEEEIQQTTEEKIEDVENRITGIDSVLAQLNLKIIVNKENIDRVKVAYLILEGLAKVGIKCSVNELTSEEMQYALENKDYDLAMIGWELSNVPDISSIIFQSGYVDEGLNQMLISLNNTISKTEIKEKYNKVQDYMNVRVPFISLAIKNEYIVNNTRIDGDMKSNSFKMYNQIGNLNIK